MNLKEFEARWVREQSDNSICGPFLGEPADELFMGGQSERNVSSKKSADYREHKPSLNQANSPKRLHCMF